MDTFLKIILSIPVPKRQTISHWRRGKSTRPDMQVSEQIKKAEPMKQKFLMHYTPHKWPSNPDEPSAVMTFPSKLQQHYIKHHIMSKGHMEKS